MSSATARRHKMHALLKQAEAKWNEASALLSPADGSVPTDETIAKAQGLKAEGDRLMAAGKLADEAAEASAALNRPLPRQVAEPPLVVREAGLDDPAYGFKSFGEFAQAVANAYATPHPSYDRRLFLATAGTGMTQSVQSEGGILVPPSFSQSIWDGLRQNSESMLSRCDVITVDRSVESVTFPKIAETNRGNGYRWGGIQGYWKTELATMTESRGALDGVTVKPNELYVLCYASDKLIRNSPISLEGFLFTKMQDEINFKLGDAIWNGTGAGQPRGILEGSALISVDKETGQAADTVLAENVINMFARLHPAARSGAAWYVCPQAEKQLMTAYLQTGTGGQLVYMPPGGLSGSPYGTLLGLPVIPTEFNAGIGDVGDIVLANLRYYLVGIKAGAEMSSSIHVKWLENQTAFRIVVEADGLPWVDAVTTPFKDTSYTQSPFVALAAR